MTAAVILLWGGCLWSITRFVLSFLAASSWRKLTVLAVLILAASCAHKPLPQMKQNTPISDDK